MVQIVLEGTNTARREVGISHVRWMVEPRREENEVIGGIDEGWSEKESFS